MANPPQFKELVLVGGGHSHVEVLRRFGMARLENAGVTVICRDVDTPYSGMLPGHVAGLYTYDDIHIDLRPLCRFAGARLFVDEAVGLDLAQRQVQCRNRPPVRFDVLSIDTGSTPALERIPGAAGMAIPVKPISGFLAGWEALRRRVKDSPDRLRIAVIGTGAGGVEILLSIQRRLQSPQRLEFHLFGADAEVMATHNTRVRRTFREVLVDRGVHLHLGARVDRIDAGHIRIGGESFPFDEVLVVTEAGAPGWPKEAGLAVDDKGFILVDDCLRSLSHPDVFATGDVATMVNHRRPKAGVFAVRQGPPLARNLRRAVRGEALQPFRPQRLALALISTGERRAVASRGALSMRGTWLWTVKDWIDRRFMRRFNTLPAMATPPAAAADMTRCGGCGAKIGAGALDTALAGLRPVEREDILLGLAARDDAAVVAVPPGKVMVHSVDYFRAFIDDPYRFGRIAANHALGDLYAMNAAPQSALAIATLPFGPERRVAETLRAMLDGALAALRESGASLVGGHSGEGAELALGFAVNGLADPLHLGRKAGMRPGDRLILTKPVGTGTLLAANMHGKAKGRWIEGALHAMETSNREAARIVFAHGATACTDVTGFGLIGHLVEMLRASKVGATLDLGAVPILDGAIETASAGFLSTLHPENARFGEFVVGGTTPHPNPLPARRGEREQDEGEGLAANARWRLLFDPQTAGGLLAAIPGDRAAGCLDELGTQYESAAIIGTVAPHDGGPPVRLR